MDGGLSQVGMENIEMSVRVAVEGNQYCIPAQMHAFVSLDAPDVKGIHMSRLYLALQKEFDQSELSLAACKKVVKEFLASHAGLSRSASLRVQFELPIRRKALLSENQGWRNYPVEIKVEQNGQNVATSCMFRILYSSTCPCSAALAKQLVQEQFKRDFASVKAASSEDVVSWLGSAKGIIATPHGQRSIGKISVWLDSNYSGDIIQFLCKAINAIEKALATPVQTAVKREDEQEFARLNGAHPMFAEDAARKMAKILRSTKGVVGFRARAMHLESLHPHDAVAVSEWAADGLE